MNYRIILLLLFLAGCGSAPPAPTDHFYRLPATEPATGPALTDQMLQVQPLRVGGLLRERGIIYVDSSASVELKRYHYHLWHETPGVLVAHHLAEFLRSAGAAGLVTSGRSVAAEWIVGGDIHEFMQVREGDGGQVIISLELRLYKDQGRQVLLQQIYNETETVDGKGMNAVVAAFARALDRIYSRFLNDAHQAADH